MAKIGQLLRRGPVAQHQGRDIPWQNMHGEEDDEADPDEDED